MRSTFSVTPLYITIIICCLNTNKLGSQQLSINETIDYINKLELNDTESGLRDEITLKEQGYISIKRINRNRETVSWLKDAEFLSLYGETYIKFHHSDIDIKDIPLSKTFFTLRCLQDEKCIKAYVNNLSTCNFGSDDPYLTKKLYNAWSYLLNLLSESKIYQRGALDSPYDPFSPSNFNKGKVQGDEPKIQIPLSQEGGVYTLTIYIGSMRLVYILDSGASETTITSDIERQLIEAGLISRDNYLGSGLYKLANGSIIEQRRILIPKIKLGSYFVYNIPVTVGTNESSMLLGKNVLDRFKNWSIDNSNERSQLILEKF
jgi:predicted aspartyl protease